MDTKIFPIAWIQTEVWQVVQNSAWPCIQKSNMDASSFSDTLWSLTLIMWKVTPGSLKRHKYSHKYCSSSRKMLLFTWPWISRSCGKFEVISKISGADPGIYFGGGQTKVPNRKSRAKPESRARSARVSRAKPESRTRSARELRAKPEPRAKPEKKRGEGSGEGARWAPPQKIFEKSNLKSFILVHIWSNYLKWLTKWFNCHFHEKSLVIVWCDGIIKFCWSIKFDRGSGGRSPPEAKTF